MRLPMQGSAIIFILVLAASGTAGAQPTDAKGSGYRFTTDWTTKYTEHWIEHLQEFVGKPNVRGLEIGCFEGRSTLWFVDHVLTHPTSHMTCIDVFTEDIEERFDHNVRVSGMSHKITKIKGYSQDALRTAEYDSFDFIYIDGCHLASCVLTDAVLSWDLLKTGGIMIFDDYLWRLHLPLPERPKIGIDAFLQVFKDRIHIRRSADQLIIEKATGRTKQGLVGDPDVHRWQRYGAGGSDPESMRGK